MSTAGNIYTPETVLGGEKIISADSHIVEPEDLWIKNLPSSMKDLPEISQTQFARRKARRLRSEGAHR